MLLVSDESFGLTVPDNFKKEVLINDNRSKEHSKHDLQ